MYNLPREVFVGILTLVCDLEFEHPPLLEKHSKLQRAYFQGNPRSRRSLKQSLSPIRRVCKEWKNIIETDSTFWITTLINISAKVLGSSFSPARIFGHTQDDLVVSLSLRTYNESAEWIKSHILPFSRRLQKLMIRFEDTHCPPPLFLLLATAPFPKLLGLTLNFKHGHSLLPAETYPEPCLPDVRSLSLTVIPWETKEVSPQNLRGLELQESIHVLWDTGNLGRTISPCSRSLVIFTLKTPAFGEYSSLGILAVYPAVILPRLSKLSIEAPSVSCVVHFLETMQLPVLKNLHLRAASRRRRGGEPVIEDMPIRKFAFNSLNYVAIETPVRSALHLFERLDAPNIEGLSIAVLNLRPMDMNIAPDPRRKVFGKLRALHVHWNSHIHRNGDVSCLNQFSAYFDISQVSEHASVTITTPSRIGTPPMNKITTL